MTEKNPAVREILVAVCGLTPQVVTETLYYLTQVRKPPSEIREIFIITTGDGAEKAATSLLAKPGGKFHELCSE